MIVDKLSNAAFYHVLGSRFEAALNYLARTDFSTLPNGRIDVQGNDVFALVQRYDSRLPTPADKWEAHRTYHDIQYVFQGQEQIGYTGLDDLEVTDPYDQTRDAVLFKTRQGHVYDFVRVPSGVFTIFAPHDAHQPGMALGQSAKVSKVVMKVRV